MGIYDREYYRRGGPSFLGSLTGQGAVCKWLIVANAVIFALQLWGPKTEVDREKVNPRSGRIVVPETASKAEEYLELDVRRVAHGEVWRLLTYSFLHSRHQILHIVFNMLFLWWFGHAVEDIYGPREFLAFYLASAFLGGLAFQAAWAANLSAAELCVGASGAVTAVMVLFALHYPTHRIYLWFFLPIPIWVFVVFQVAQDTLIFASGAASQTAVAVHLGGAIFGFLYHKMHWRLMRLWPDWRGWQRVWSRPRLQVYRGEEARRPVAVAAPPPDAGVDEQLEAKVDAVLEKVARFGQESLTETERQILVRAGEVYKRKRRT